MYFTLNTSITIFGKRKKYFMNTNEHGKMPKCQMGVEMVKEKNTCTFHNYKINSMTVQQNRLRVLYPALIIIFSHK